MNYLYILYSKSANRYYVGETDDPALRLDQHKSHFYKGSYTALATDWECKLLLQFDNRIQARAAESFIKKMKSKVFIERLIQDSNWFEEKFKT